MTAIEKTTTVARIKTALKTITGRPWSVTAEYGLAALTTVIGRPVCAI
jgi:hypothetical protein